MVNMSYALCPKCGDEAFSKAQVKEIFGFRTRKSGKQNVGQTLPQSNCKKCRARIQKQRRRLGLQVSR
ncbi:hypothetical protein AAA799B03_01348 [Marine Group I thaumarchaeote SCGC AAA799-B03]|uniref:50S ribosomal protein L34e n=1 Tax=Marine Group I thaumarchaeote SCGC AAA799-B03 TaxID=1502289 RepID=A0A087S5Y0_9ARCH|nr:hypothetical protein AAA799B03_01348 [Marine Group I thaumarchaeote SCGC AAA799-B03]